MTARPIDVEAARLVLETRWSALATAGERGPLASMVAYAAEPGLRGLLMFLSGLSEHTRNLMVAPGCSMAVSRSDPGTGDPQTLARVTLNGSASPLPRNGEPFAELWPVYASAFPEAVPRLGLPDFVLFRFRIDTARYVGGFARAFTISGERLAQGAEEA
jgi:putative heme iron utilization protein